MTYPVVTCLLVAALCFAISSYTVPALIVVAVALALEFYLPGVGLNARVQPTETE